MKLIKILVVMSFCLLIISAGAFAHHGGSGTTKAKYENKCEKAQRYLLKSTSATKVKYQEKYYKKYLHYSKYCEADGQYKCDKALKYLAKSEAATKPKNKAEYFDKYLKYSVFCNEPTNTAPVTSNVDLGSVNIGNTYTGNLSDLTATDVEDDSLTLERIIVTQPTNGTLVINPNGTFTYTASAISGSDTFTFKVKDSGGLESNVSTVSINVLEGDF